MIHLPDIERLKKEAAETAEDCELRRQAKEEKRSLHAVGHGSRASLYVDR